MQIEPTELDGVFIVIPEIHGDNRGWFMETYKASSFKENGIVFVQDNQSFSKGKGTLRGIHFQQFPYAQSKLVRCLKGAILDVAVDLRAYSPNYKKWIAVELSQENKKQLLIPRGFGHGFVTLTDDVEIAYKCDDYYNALSDRSIRFDDDAIGIRWGVREPILSLKDVTAPTLDKSDCNFSARILVTGACGQLGYDVIRLLKNKGVECLGCDREDFDFTDLKAAAQFIKAYKPTVIVHCGAYTAVDQAEEDALLCEKINVDGTRNIAKICSELNSKLVYISTDYVYGGEGRQPLKENDETKPQTVYGRTKLAGESAVKESVKNYFIIRTSWVFGKNGGNFVKTMLRLAREKREISVVNDQIGAPTYTVDLAELIVNMLFTERYGTYNAANCGFCSWYDFAKEIFRQEKAAVLLKGIPSDQYPSKASRPLNSRFNQEKLLQSGFEALPDWKDALKRFLKELG